MQRIRQIIKYRLLEQGFYSVCGRVEEESPKSSSDMSSRQAKTQTMCGLQLNTGTKILYCNYCYCYYYVKLVHFGQILRIRHALCLEAAVQD